MSLTDLQQMAGRATFHRPFLLLKQVLEEGLIELAAQRWLLEHLLERVDVPQRPGEAERWTRDRAQEVMALVQRTDQPLVFDTAYPDSAVHLPRVVLLPSGGGRDDSALEGPFLAPISLPQAGPEDPTTGAKSVRVIEPRLIPWTTQVQISTWIPSTELALVVHDLLIAVVSANEARLTEAGVREISMLRERELMQPAWEREQAPVVPSFELTLRWERIVPRSLYPVPTQVRRSGTTIITS